MRASQALTTPMRLTHAERLPTLDKAQIDDGEELDVAADFDDFAGDFLAKNQSLPGGGAAADHLSIAATELVTATSRMTPCPHLGPTLAGWTPDPSPISSFA